MFDYEALLWGDVVAGLAVVVDGFPKLCQDVLACTTGTFNQSGSLAGVFGWVWCCFGSVFGWVWCCLGVSLTGFDVVSTFFVLFSDFFQSSSSEAAKKTKQTAIIL